MIRPVILCGGTGTRLWPISRRAYPKQFLKLIGKESLFQQAAKRVSGEKFLSPYVITSNEFLFHVQRQLREINISCEKIILEPEQKNTAAAILAAAYQEQKNNPETVLLIVTSDHFIPDVEYFKATVTSGVSLVQEGDFLVFGIKPDTPHTEYGYIQLSDEANQLSNEFHQVKSFKEKPCLQTAKKFLARGNYLWNSGMFLFKTSTLIEKANVYQPDIAKHTGDAVSHAQTAGSLIHLAKKDWAFIESKPIDKAILEKTENMLCKMYFSDWSDIGSLEALSNLLRKDVDKNSSKGDVIHTNCKNSFFWVSEDSKPLISVGTENLLAISMKDTTLLVDKSKTHHIPKILNSLKNDKNKLACTFNVDFRPWGWFETLIKNCGYHAKKLHVYPGGVLSLQSHKHRSEHWVVVEGTATVFLDGTTSKLAKNKSIYIPTGAKHRLANETNEDLVVIEVQTGTYLEEDDIVRYEDIYSRV